MKIYATFDGVDQVVAEVTSLAGRVADDLHTATRKATLDIQAEARRLIQDTPKTGRIYKRGGVSHQASAPGESPANDAGTLAESIQARMTGYIQGEVEPTAEYADYLEFGTEKMEPRPYMFPAYEHVRPSYDKVCKAIAKKHSG